MIYPNENMAFMEFKHFCTWKNIKSAYNNNKFCSTTKHLFPTWNDEFDLPDGSYSIENIQD